MSDLLRLLRTLETLPGLSATRKEWRLRTGDAYPVVEDLLKPTGQIMGTMPCFNELLGLHYHDVIEYTDESADAVFADEYHDCPSFSVERHERAAMTPDMPALCRRICPVLALDPNTETLSFPRGIYEIGGYYPVESYRFPVLLALRPSPTRVEEALCAVTALENRPFIFLTATRAHLSDRASTLIIAHDILFRSLAEYLLFREGRMTATKSWGADIRAFHDKHVPKPEPVQAFFSTPPGATWEDVVIRFVDGHTVSVTVAGVSGRYSYIEMHMANRRESKPSTQWEFLEQIAENHGLINYDEKYYSKKNKDWKYELSSKLRNFFRIDDDPFRPYDSKHKCWEARFTVTPVANK